MTVKYNLLSDESKIAYLFYDKITRSVIHNLWNGIHNKDEIYNNIKSKIGKKKDISNVIKNMADIGILNDDGEFVYMIQDVEIFKTLPLLSIASSENIFTKEVVDKYKENVLIAFSEENIEISNMSKMLVDDVIYSMLVLLRKMPMRLSEIADITGKEQSDIKDAIEKMIKNDILMCINIDGEKWVFLLCDIRARTFFPDYFIRMYEMNKSLESNGTASRHIDELIENFPK